MSGVAVEADDAEGRNETSRNAASDEGPRVEVHPGVWI